MVPHGPQTSSQVRNLWEQELLQPKCARWIEKVLKSLVLRDTAVSLAVRPRASQFCEILEDRDAVFGQYALRMELDRLNAKIAVTKAHYAIIFFGSGGDD